MTKFRIWYTRPERFADFASGLTWCRVHDSLPRLPREEQRETATHILLTEIEASSLEEAYAAMQAERWSPNGEATNLIMRRGLSHTSMSVGDMAEDEQGRFWFCDNFGFTQLGDGGHACGAP